MGYICGNMENAKSQDKKTKLKRIIIETCKEILVAVIIIAIILGSLWAYTGNWPPIVVVESNSMMHDDDSSIGLMDTGDIVLLKSVSARHEIKTYVDGKKSGYRTYGLYGNVIAFSKNGQSGTPVIHRAVVWIEYNNSGHNYDSNLKDFGSYDIPSLGLYDVTKFNITDYWPKNTKLDIDLNRLLSNFKKFNRQPHSGYLTKGDKNREIDQLSSITDPNRHPIEPIKTDWVMGKAEGELPWFGLIKLYIGGETSMPDSNPPPTSVKMLGISITLIIILLIIILFFSDIVKLVRRKKSPDIVLKISGEDQITKAQTNNVREQRTTQSTTEVIGAQKEPDLKTKVTQIGRAPLAIPQTTVTGCAPRAIPVTSDTTTYIWSHQNPQPIPDISQTTLNQAKQATIVRSESEEKTKV